MVHFENPFHQSKSKFYFIKKATHGQIPYQRKIIEITV